MRSLQGLFDEGLVAPTTFAALPPELASWERARVAIVPVPYDGTASYRPGARRGPAAVLEASAQLEWYDEELGFEPCAVGVATLPPLEVAVEPERTLARVERVVADVLQGGKWPVVLGGDHSITVGAVRAVHGQYDGELGVLQLDAHADLRDAYQGSRWSHACVARRLLELGCRVAQVGVRSLSKGEAEFLQQSDRVQTVFAHELRAGLGPALDAIEALPERVYVTLDLDALDPAAMPAVGTPEPGGLSWPELLQLLRRTFERKRVVGCDVVELCPVDGLHAPEFTAARLVYKLIGYWARFQAQHAKEG